MDLYNFVRQRMRPPFILDRRQLACIEGTYVDGWADGPMTRRCASAMRRAQRAGFTLERGNPFGYTYKPWRTVPVFPEHRISDSWADAYTDCWLDNAGSEKCDLAVQRLRAKCQTNPRFHQYCRQALACAHSGDYRPRCTAARAQTERDARRRDAELRRVVRASRAYHARRSRRGYP